MAMTKKQVNEFYRSKGYHSIGSLDILYKSPTGQPKIQGNRRRIVLQALSFRVEKEYRPGEFVRVGGGYYKYTTLDTELNKLRISG